MEKVNIAELLKDCSRGMELDCTMYEDVYFDYVDELNIIHCYIQRGTHKTSLTFNYNGTPNCDTKSKCVIFPKGKTTWEDFVPPYKFKDGDILFVKSAYDWLLIYKESENDVDLYKYVATSHNYSYSFITYECIPICRKKEVSEIRLATKEEKQKLFDAIKANGYKWNPETKTLEKLSETKFKVGDRVKQISACTQGIIVKITDKGYHIDYPKGEGVCYVSFTLEKDYELAPNKFDITTLKPFDKVLMRSSNAREWVNTFYSHYSNNKFYGCGMCCDQCIPYEKNEHLLGTTNDCDEYFKNW